MKNSFIIFIVVTMGFISSSIANRGDSASTNPLSQGQSEYRGCPESLPVDAYMKCLERGGVIPRGFSTTKNPAREMANLIGCDPSASDENIIACLSRAIRTEGRESILSFFGAPCAQQIFREESDYLRCMRLQNTSRILRRTAESGQAGTI